MIDWDKLIHDTGLFWQYPVKTEKEFYNQNKFDPNYIGIPWATIIDKNLIHNIQLRDHFKAHAAALNQDQLYTCCQHCYYYGLIDWFKELNIKTVHVSHKRFSVDDIKGVKLVSCPLYAVNIEDDTRNQLFQEISDEEIINENRELLYSFIGAHDVHYLSEVRLRLFEMDHPENSFIKQTGSWHFNSSVFTNKQNSKYELDPGDDHDAGTQLYNKVLKDSTFSICPVGAGPNTIRLWESMAVGSIPVILSDLHELPGHDLWKYSIIRIKESEIHNMQNILTSVSSETIKIMRANLLELYAHFRKNFKNE